MSDRHYLYRDSVHGDVEIDPFCTCIIDTPEVQRLGRIKELGFTDLVYRGATHTRLSHMIGVYGLTRRLFRIVEENHRRWALHHPGWYLEPVWGDNDHSKWENCSYVVAWASLLHDLTHIPFGHTLEDEFWNLYIDHDALFNPRQIYLWGREQYKNISGIYKAFQEGVHLLPSSFPNSLRDPDRLLSLIHLIVLYREEHNFESGSMASFEEKIEEAIKDAKKAEESSLMDSKAKEDVTSFLSNLRSEYSSFTDHKLYEPFMTDFISNSICADLLDYLERDAMYTGLELKYDERILRAFVLERELPGSPQSRCRLALKIVDRRVERTDMVTDVLNLMKMRHDLALKVYYHKTKAAASSMLVKALDLLGDRRPADIPQNKENSMINYRMGDEGLLETIHQQAKRMERSRSLDANEKRKGAQAKKLVEDLRNRHLYKVLVLLPYKALEESDPDETIYKLRKRAHEISRTIAEKFRDSGLDGHHLLLYVPGFAGSKEVYTRALHTEGKRLVLLGNHEAIKDVIQELNKKDYKRLWKMLLLIHPDYVPSGPGDIENTCLCSEIVDELEKEKELHEEVTIK